MAPDQRGEMGDVAVVATHALLPDVANGQFSRISARLMVPLLRLLNGP
jgi:hypothetical protein